MEKLKVNIKVKIIYYFCTYGKKVCEAYYNFGKIDEEVIIA
jgi:hypothetical protein